MTDNELISKIEEYVDELEASPGTRKQVSGVQFHDSQRPQRGNRPDMKRRNERRQMSNEQPSQQALEKARAYTFEVQWSQEDEVFVGRTVEWSSLAAHGETDAEALEEIKRAVAFAIEDCEADGQEYPEPFSLKEFSGRFNVRIPPELHRELVTGASRQGVSLNQYVTLKLARG